MKEIECERENKKGQQEYNEIENKINNLEKYISDKFRSNDNMNRQIGMLYCIWKRRKGYSWMERE